jgi:hypothetical protein
MFQVLLSLHSLVRWLVLISLVMVIVQGYWGFRTNRPFSMWDNRARVLAVTIAHAQLLLGLILYGCSPMVDYFLHNFNEAVHMREIRFFGMEHITMMVIAVVVLTIGSIKTKNKKTDQEKFRILLSWFAVVFFIILVSIPWSFSPFTSRPLLRPF